MKKKILKENEMHQSPVICQYCKKPIMKKVLNDKGEVVEIQKTIPTPHPMISHGAHIDCVMKHFVPEMKAMFGWTDNDVEKFRQEMESKNHNENLDLSTFKQFCLNEEILKIKKLL